MIGLIKSKCTIVVAYLSLFFVSIYSYVTSKDYLYRVFPANGDFQNFNPIRRMQNGQIPFVDFFPYTATFPMWCLSHLCTLLHITTFSPFLVTIRLITIALGCILLIWLAFQSTRCLAASVILACVLISISMTLPIFTDLSHYIQPEHTTLLIRSMPSILFAIALVNYSVSQKPLRSLILVSMVSGLTLIWSNDYAATGVILCPIFILLLRKKTIANQIKSLIIFFFVTGAVFSVLLLTITHGHYHQFFEFNSSVADTQSWYFSPGYKKIWGDFLLQKISNIFQIVEYPPFRIATLFMILSGYLGWKFKTREYKSIFIFFTFLYLGGLIATIGGQIGHYFVPINLFGYTLCICILLQNILNFISIRFTRPAKVVLAVTLSIVPFCVLFLVQSGGYLASNIPRRSIFTAGKISPKPKQLLQPLVKIIPKSFLHYSVPKKEYSQELEGRFEIPFLELNQFFKDHSTNRIFSTYATTGEISQNTFQPSGIDYVIHALGPVYQNRFKSYFNQSDYVITLNPISIGWEYWIMNANWYLYREIFLNYHVVKQTDFHTFWEKNKDKTPPYKPQEPHVQFNESTSRLEITNCKDMPTDGIVELTLELNKKDLSMGNYFRGYIRDITQAQLMTLADPYSGPSNFIGIQNKTLIQFPFNLKRGCSIPLISIPNPISKEEFNVLSIQLLNIPDDVYRYGYFERKSTAPDIDPDS